MEKHLSEIYSRSQKELEKKTKKFWADFERKDVAKKKKLDAGEITETDYKKWRKGQLMTGKHWDEMTKAVAEEMVNADKTAAAYVNGKLPEIYSLNYNALADQTAGIKGYSFELVNADAVKHLATTDKSLLPYKVVDGKKVERWNTQKVNSEVLQGIIQGESVQKIAKRLSNVVGMEKNSAIRNARTTTTGAENRGRLDSYQRAQKDGIILKKRWIATHDHRTRDWHTELDNVEVDIDEPFVNSIGEIMFPGDPEADPSNVYNCRCAMVSEIKGYIRKGNDVKGYDVPEFDVAEQKPIQKSESKYPDEMSEKGYVGLSGEESDKFIEEYHNKKIIGKHETNTMIGGQSRRINNSLRNGNMPSDPNDVKMVQRLDKAIQDNKLPEDMTLFRGVDKDAFKDTGLFDKIKNVSVDMNEFKDETGRIDFDKWGKEFEKETDKWLSKMLNAAKQMRGMEITDNGFMQVSASSQRNIFVFSDFNIQIHAPKGTNAYISDYKEESEILLSRGTTIRVLDASIAEVTTDNGAKKKVVQLIAELVRKK